MDPVAKGWVRAAIDLWCRLRKAPRDSLLGSAVRESLAQYKTAELNEESQTNWAGRFMRMVKSFSKQGRDTNGAVADFLATKGVSGPLNQDIVEIPWVRVWASWDAMLQEPWDKVSECANPRQVASSLVKVATYNCWFVTGPLPQEELDAGYPQGMPRYIRHTSGIPFAYVKQLMRFRTGAHHLAIETGRWVRPTVPRQLRTCSKCSHTVVEDEMHFLFECPAYESIRIKYDSVLFNKFGGCRQASRVFKNDPAKVREFMDQEPCFQVAKFVYECMEYRRSEECEDCEPYFDLSLFGEDWQGQVYDTFSSDLRGVSEESFTSTENGTSLSAHGAQVAPSGRPLGGANL